MAYLGDIGDVVETGRSIAGFSSFEWRIPDFPSLAGEEDDFYTSPSFDACGGGWRFRIYPNGLWEYPSDSVPLILWRVDSGPPQTFDVTLGIRGAEGVENKRGRRQEFSEDDYACLWRNFCSRRELSEHNSRLMPGNVLILSLDMKIVVPTVARGSSDDDEGGDDAGDSNDDEEDDDDKAPKSKNNVKQNAKKRELPSDVLVTYSYKELQTATQNFGDLPYRVGGCKIGEGGFGTVYRAVIRGDVVAVKRLKDPLDTQFITELKTLTNFKHVNLVPLLGFSIGPNCCLVYEYMPNGSLEDRLACKDRSEPLSWQSRLSISYGSALGINHLHTFGEHPEVHRDIKSANILLDQNFVAKVGDFGLVRTGSSGGSTTLPVTQRCIGTPGYMPREALVGDVSVKWDTFSFGVVLLELLTGLPPYDRNRKDKYLITHMENCKDILSRLDSKAKWDKKAATELYRITQRCLAESKRSRPTISEILEDLRKLSLLR